MFISVRTRNYIIASLRWKYTVYAQYVFVLTKLKCVFLNLKAKNMCFRFYARNANMLLLSVVITT